MDGVFDSGWNDGRRDNRGSCHVSAVHAVYGAQVYDGCCGCGGVALGPKLSGGARLGPPLKVLHETARRYLIYSDTTNTGSYQVRKIGIDQANKVNNIVAGWYWD
jgi:hypothetical protein